MIKLYLCLSFAVLTLSSPLEDQQYFEEDVNYSSQDVHAALSQYNSREKRSLQPGAPNFPIPGNEPNTKISPHITTQDGTTNIGAAVEHKTGNHDIGAHINQNVRGPGRSSRPNWGVRGTFRRRRSLQQGEEPNTKVSPHINTQDGTTNIGATVDHKIGNHDVGAHVNQNVRGPGKSSRPNWGVRGTFRWRRSPQAGEEPNTKISPHINTQDGTTNVGATVDHKIGNHEVGAHVNQNVRGPGRSSRPNWGVRGTFRWRRSPQAGEEPNTKFSPHINTQDGTTNIGATVDHKIGNHDVGAHVNQNVRGPGKSSRPNWGVRGTFRWRRSPQAGEEPNTKISPHINTQDGTTNIGATVDHKIGNHEVGAHVNQNVRGPGRSSRPNWGVRGTFRWRRSPQAGEEPNTKISPHINTQDGTTNVGATVDHKIGNHEVGAHVNQNVRGPGRSSRPNWGVRGTFRWRRSPQAGEEPNTKITPHINTQDGTTNIGATVDHKIGNHEVGGHVNQNVRGPGRSSRPNWGIRGTFRWRRSPQAGEEPNTKISPHINTQDGTTNVGATVDHKIGNHEVGAHVNQHVRGPGRSSRPNWGVRGTFRWRRSLQPGAPSFPLPGNEPNTKVSPHITNQDGTTNVGATIDHKIGNHDIGGHINQNVRGPGRSSRPNWGVRGTFRWRRSLQPGAPSFPLPGNEPNTKVSPHITTQDGTTNVGATIDHKSGKHEVGGHINQNVRGPGRSSRPNWGVRGTFRW